MPIVLLRITGRTLSTSFVAGVVVVDGIVAKTAPILKYTRGWFVTHLIDHVVKKHWTLEVIQEQPSPRDIRDAVRIIDANPVPDPDGPNLEEDINGH